MAATPSRALHVSYATAGFAQAARFLVRSARRFSLDTRLYGPADPVIHDLRRRYPAIMGSKRGAGYWLWKPFILLDAMKDVPDGTPVLYTDAALTFIADPAPLLALAGTHPVAMFGTSDGVLASTWTKRDCFIELQADTPEFWGLAQVWAGFQLYRAGPEARAFLHDLCEAMANEVALTDRANVHGGPDLPDFKAHRHDQSVLTVVAHKAGVPVFRDPSQFGRWREAPRDAPFGQTVHLHRKRDTHLPNLVWRQMRGVYTGGRGFA